MSVSLPETEQTSLGKALQIVEPDRNTHRAECLDDRTCLIVEDRLETRAWLQKLVREAFPNRKQATAGSLFEARSWLAANTSAGHHCPPLAIVDLGLPDGPGVDLVREICEGNPDAIVVVATIYDDDLHVFAALSAGAQGYLLKQDEAATIVDRLKRIEEGEPPLSASIARRLLERLRRPGLFVSKLHPPHDAHLTAREEEILTYLAQGLSGPTTARLVGLKPQTVAGYIKVIYQKLHVSSRAEAALAAAARGLL